MDLMALAELYLKRKSEEELLRKKEEKVLSGLEEKVQNYCFEQKKSQFETEERYGDIAMEAVNFLMQKHRLAFPRYNHLCKKFFAEGNLVRGLPGKLKDIIGLRGKVVDLRYFNKDTIGVEWERQVQDGHYCGNRARQGRGLYVSPTQLKRVVRISDYSEFLEELVDEVIKAPTIGKYGWRNPPQEGDKVIINYSSKHSGGMCGEIEDSRNQYWFLFLTRKAYLVSLDHFRIQFLQKDLSPLIEITRLREEAREMVGEACKIAEKKYHLPISFYEHLKQHFGSEIQVLRECGWEEERIKGLLKEKIPEDYLPKELYSMT